MQHSAATDGGERRPSPVEAPPSRIMTENPGHQEVAATSVPTQTSVTNMDMDLTENCNLGCTYCFKGDKTTQNMSLDTAKKSVEWLLAASGAADSVNVNFMGGEPTMAWKIIKELVPWARRRGRSMGKMVTFSMTSNLTLWNEEIREFVDRWGFGVLMSIDGHPDVQEAQRPSKNGKPTWQVIEKWARSMLETRPSSQARATVHPTNVDRFYDGMEYLHSIGFAEVAVSASSYEEWTDEQMAKLEEELDRVAQRVIQRHREGVAFNLTGFKFCIKKLIHPRRTDTAIEEMPQPCGAGKGYMMVDYTGDIWPCHRFDGADADAGTDGQMRLGNIFGEGFDDELQRTFIDFDHRVNHKEACNTCPVNEVCGGYCPAANLSDTGSIYTPHDAYCHWSQSMYRAAETVYDTLAKEGGEPFERLLASCEFTESSGDR